METCNENLGAWTDQVRRFLVARLGSRGLSSDLAQEAATRLLQVVRAGKGPRDPRAWMFRTARNLAVDEVRRRLPCPLGLEALGEVVDPESIPVAESLMPVGAREVDRSDLVTLLPNALDRLPNHYRRLILAHYRDGLDCAAVAERECITVANAKVRLFRARRQLQQLLRLAAHSN